jgi:hypothetical protein
MPFLQHQLMPLIYSENMLLKWTRLPKTQDSPSDVNSLPFSAAGETDYNLIFPGGGQITIFYIYFVLK